MMLHVNASRKRHLILQKTLSGLQVATHQSLEFCRCSEILFSSLNPYAALKIESQSLEMSLPVNNVLPLQGV